MNQTQWDNLNAFAAATNTSLVFGLRATSGGPANDTARLLEYSFKSGYTIHGFEWGNEVGCQTGDSLSALAALVDRTWSDPADRPVHTHSFITRLYLLHFVFRFAR